MQTCAMVQSLGPQVVPSGAGAVAQPVAGSQSATRHGSAGAGHAVSKCTQPPTGSQASTVQRFESSQLVALPTQAPPRHWPPARQALLLEHDVPSTAFASTQVLVAGSRCEVRQAEGAVQCAGSTP